MRKTNIVNYIIIALEYQNQNVHFWDVPVGVNYKEIKRNYKYAWVKLGFILFL